MIKECFPYGDYKGNKLFLKRITKSKAKTLLKNKATIFIGKGGFYEDINADILFNKYFGFMELTPENFIKKSLENFIYDYEFYNYYTKENMKFFEIVTEDDFRKENNL